MRTGSPSRASCASCPVPHLSSGPAGSSSLRTRECPWFPRPPPPPPLCLACSEAELLQACRGEPWPIPLDGSGSLSRRLRRRPAEKAGLKSRCPGSCWKSPKSHETSTSHHHAWQRHASEHASSFVLFASRSSSSSCRCLVGVVGFLVALESRAGFEALCPVLCCLRVSLWRPAPASGLKNLRVELFKARLLCFLRLKSLRVKTPSRVRLRSLSPFPVSFL